METPKQKAESLVDKYHKLFSVDLENTISIYEAIECAKIAVDQILELDVIWLLGDIQKDYPQKYSFDQTREYWQEVKTELNKL